MKRHKERDKDSPKPKQPDKREVICPLIFKLTELAVNYDLSWQPETKVIVEDDQGFVTSEVTGVWKSNPVLRGHTDVFQEAIHRMRKEGQISWDEMAYYFTHEEGLEARKAYETEVLEGRLRAHITSWGPNPAKANDKSRFHKFTGVTFEELKEKYPDLYKPKTAVIGRPKSEEKENLEVTVVKKEGVAEPEPTENELKKIEDEEKVAAAKTVEATDELLESPIIQDEDEDEDKDDHNVIVLYADSNMQEAQETLDDHTETIHWEGDDKQPMTAYLMLLPEIDTEMWLPEGKFTINGVAYEVRREDK